MALIKLLLNFGMLFTMLFAPAILLLAFWYKKQFTGVNMVWKKSEHVVVTIVYSISVLILFIVGVSCLFTYLGYLESTQIGRHDPKQFLNLGFLCFLLIVAFTMLYFAVRMLMIQVVNFKGIMLNDPVFRIPNYQKVLEWHQIADYYIVSDYPNVIFTLIVQKDSLTFDRVSLRVPIYVREGFNKLLENNLSSASTKKARAQFIRSNSPEK